VVLSVLCAWLYSWTRQDDFCVGLSIAGRDHTDTESLIGFFVNVLPIRVHLSREKEFDDLLGEIQQASEEALERQHYPFDRLIQVLNPERQSNRQPLINVVYAFQNFADVRVPGAIVAAATARQEVRVSDFSLDFPTSKFDLTFFVSNEAGGLQVAIEYDTGLFRPATIERCAAAIRRCAASIAGAGLR
jgi:non-ribosomal peptide synthetase component F